MKRVILGVVILTVGLAQTSLAASVYIRAGGTCTGPDSACSDWTQGHAYPTLPNTLTRGNVYYIADGIYPGYKFDDAVSGSTLITIKKAVHMGDHGTGVGWLSDGSYGDGQAIFNGSFILNKGYYFIDGATRNESNWKDGSKYGFRASAIYANSVSSGDIAAFSTVQYVELGGSYSDTYYSGMGEALYLVYNQHDIKISRCFLHNALPAIAQLAGSYNMTIEYCWFGPGWGKVAIRGGNNAPSHNWTIKHNVFWNSTQTDPRDNTSGLTAEIGIWASDTEGSLDDNSIYGNIFYNQKSGHRNSVIVVGGNGSSWAGVGAANTRVYNNTIAGIADDPVTSAILLNGTNTEAKNNLFYDTPGIAGTSVSATRSENNVALSADPFVNYSGLNFRLAAGVAGTSLPSPYNKDSDNVTRGEDGVFDAGAYEFTIKRYVRLGATGNGSGSDWINAYPSLPAILQRGYVYYIADTDNGASFGSYTFDDPGTQMITIKKATDQDHGTDTGWRNNDYGNGKTVFSSWSFNTGNYTIDGVTGGGPTRWESGFGFEIYSPQSTAVLVGFANVSNINIRHTEIHFTSNTQGQRCPADCGSCAQSIRSTHERLIYATAGLSNVTFSHCYIHDSTIDLITGGNWTNVTFEYNKFARSYSDACFHGDGIELQGTANNNLIVKYNWFDDMSVSYVVGKHEHASVNGYEVYGNVFSNIAAGNGIFATLSANTVPLTNYKFYNNSIYNCPADYNGDGGNCGINVSGSGSVINNIWYKTRSTFSTGVSYNTFILLNDEGYTPTGSNNQFITTDSNPFVSPMTGNFRLAAPTQSGLHLTGYDMDAFNVGRGSVGVWDRGAFEYTNGDPSTPNTPSAPKGLRLLP